MYIPSLIAVLNNVEKLLKGKQREGRIINIKYCRFLYAYLSGQKFLATIFVMKI